MIDEATNSIRSVNNYNYTHTCTYMYITKQLDSFVHITIQVF